MGTKRTTSDKSGYMTIRVSTALALESSLNKIISTCRTFETLVDLMKTENALLREAFPVHFQAPTWFLGLTKEEADKECQSPKPISDNSGSGRAKIIPFNKKEKERGTKKEK